MFDRQGQQAFDAYLVASRAEQQAPRLQIPLAPRFPFKDFANPVQYAGFGEERRS